MSVITVLDEGADPDDPEFHGTLATLVRVSRDADHIKASIANGNQWGEPFRRTRTSVDETPGPPISAMLTIDDVSLDVSTMPPEMLDQLWNDLVQHIDTDVLYRCTLNNERERVWQRSEGRP